MKLYEIHTGNMKLDGGAMFGVVPKSIWEKTNPPDKNNKIQLAMRCLLVETNHRLILIDTGIGDKQSQKFFSYYDLNQTIGLSEALAKYGFRLEDITDVFLTHLHFDHVGGAFRWKDTVRKEWAPVFPNAIYWSNESHWEWAVNPNPREKASFLRENILPLHESGKLKLLSKPDSGYMEIEELGIGVYFVDGHTESQMLPVLNYQGKKIIYAADLLPTIGHIHIPFVMGYDTRPLLTLEDKKNIFEKVVEQDMYLYLEHDPDYALCTLKKEDQRIKLDRAFSHDYLT